MSVKNYFITGLVCLTVFFSWKLLVEDHLTQRIPRDWSFEAEYLGNLLWGDDEGQVQRQKNLNLYQRYWNVREWHSDRAVIEDIYKTIDVQSGEVTWETKLLFHVDPGNGKIISHENHPEAEGLYYIFPQNVEQRDYAFFNYDLNPYTLRYQRSETREGLNIYVFSFQGTLDYTELFQMADVAPAMGFSGDYKIIVDNFYRELWVEPTTGELVKIIEDDPGDYRVDPVSGEKKNLISVWSGKTTGNTVKHLVGKAKKRLRQLQFYRWWIPAAFLSAALFFLAMALLALFRSQRGRV